VNQFSFLLEKLQNTWIRLQLVWEKTQEVWNDPVAWEFKQTFWDPLTAEVRGLQPVLEELARVTGEALRTVK